MSLIISEFWCGFMAGVLSLFALSIVIGLFAEAKEKKRK